MTIETTSVCLGAGIRHIHPTSLSHHLYKTNIKMYTTWHEKTKCSTKHSISENLAVFCSSETYVLRQGSWKLWCSPSIKWNQARIRKKLSQHHKVILSQTQAKHWIMVPPSPQGKKMINCAEVYWSWNLPSVQRSANHRSIHLATQIQEQLA